MGAASLSSLPSVVRFGESFGNVGARHAAADADVRSPNPYSFNTDRSRLEIGAVGEEQPLEERPDHSSSPAETPQSLTPRDLAKPEGVFELRAFTAHSSPVLANKQQNSPPRPTVHLIHIAQRVEQHSEYLGQDEDIEWEGSTARNLTSDPPVSIRRDLTRPAENAPPERRSPQEMQLLALRKVHADVVVVSFELGLHAEVSLPDSYRELACATVPGRDRRFSLHLACHGFVARHLTHIRLRTLRPVRSQGFLPFSLASHYLDSDSLTLAHPFYTETARRIEAVYFALTWMYLIAVDIALSLLLINTLRHLPPARSGQGPYDGRAPDPLPPVLFLPAAADSEDDDERIRDRDRRPFDTFQEEEGQQGAAAVQVPIP